jgi:hypothetical protein
MRDKSVKTIGPASVVHTGTIMVDGEPVQFTATIDLKSSLERAVKFGALDLDRPRAIGRSETELTFRKLDTPQMSQR